MFIVLDLWFLNMRYLFFAMIICSVLNFQAQTPTAEGLLGVHDMNMSEMNSNPTPIKGSIIYKTDTGSIHIHNGTA